MKKNAFFLKRRSSSGVSMKEKCDYGAFWEEKCAPRPAPRAPLRPASRKGMDHAAWRA
jgi:hypothetical protein